jgi:type I restriction enzyme, S subunit
MNEWREVVFENMLVDESISYGIVQPGDHTENNSVPIIRVNNIKNGRIRTDDVLKVDKGIEDKYKRTRLNGGELLITVVGSIGECAIVPEKLKGWNVARAVSVAHIKDEYDIRFIKYMFKTDDIIFQMYGNTNDTVQPTLNLSSLKSIVFNIPTLAKQISIAGILSSIDDKIDLLHCQNATLEKMAEVLFTKWFEENAKDEWEKIKLGDILDTIESGTRPKGGIDPSLKNGIPSIGAESINGIGNFEFSKTKFISNEFYKSMTRGLIRDFDVLVYKDGAYVGRKGMFGYGFPFKVCTVNEHVFILRTNSKANQFFLYFLLQEDELAQLNANSAQPGLNQAAMRSFEIQLPPHIRIQEFETIVKPFVEKILFNGNQINTLTRLRDILLPKLMNGEVRVDIN